MFCGGVTRRLKGLLFNISTRQLNKICSSCHISKDKAEFHALKGSSDGLNARCRDCRAKIALNYRCTLQGFLVNLKKNSLQRKKGYCDLSTEYLSALWYSQQGLCYFSQFPMSHSPNSDWKCSLERLDNNKGYQKGNVALICQEFNTNRQWNQEMIEALPTKINCEDLFDIDDATDNLQLLDEQINVKQKKTTMHVCSSCYLPTRRGRARFCDECTSKRATFIDMLQFIKNIEHKAKFNAGKRAKKDETRGVYSLSRQWIFETLGKQKFRCYYSNIPLEFKPGSPWSFSPERLDNDYGYIPDNTRFTCKIFNTCDNTRPKYNITGSPQWSRDKMNHFLMHRYGFTLDYAKMFT